MKKQKMVFSDVVNIAKEFCFMPTAPDAVPLDIEVRLALHTLHRLGQLLWWRDSKLLRETVIVDPQWLITAFTAVIRDPTVHPIPDIDDECARFSKAGGEMARAVELLDRSVLTDSLFKTVWPLFTGDEHKVRDVTICLSSIVKTRVCL